MRPYLLFVSAAAGMAGFADASPVAFVRTAAAFVVFFLSYGFGQALTDCFQMDTDAISSPYRPLVRGMVKREQVLAVSLAGLGLCCLVLFLLNPWSAILGLICTAGLATYTPFKRMWWAGPWYNAWIVALLPCMGKLAAEGGGFGLHGLFGQGRLIFVTAGVFFSYANFVLMGYFKDVSADRASGYNTAVVAFGWKKAAKASDLLALVSLASSVWALHPAQWILPVRANEWMPIAFFLGAAAVLVSAQVGIHSSHTEREAHGPIANVVRGFLLLRLSETACLQPEWTVPATAFYAAFEWTLSIRPERSQI
jgi:4-hydroxybenzoate polyprenyltransferase